MLQKSGYNAPSVPDGFDTHTHICTKGSYGKDDGNSRVADSELTEDAATAILEHYINSNYSKGNVDVPSTIENNQSFRETQRFAIRLQRKKNGSTLLAPPR
jgi:hypothetical protein